MPPRQQRFGKDWTPPPRPPKEPPWDGMSARPFDPRRAIARRLRTVALLRLAGDTGEDVYGDGLDDALDDGWLPSRAQEDEE